MVVRIGGKDGGKCGGEGCADNGGSFLSLKLNLFRFMNTVEVKLKQQEILIGPYQLCDEGGDGEGGGEGVVRRND